MAGALFTAASVDICKIDVRNCDTRVSEAEISLPYGTSPSWLGLSECARRGAMRQLPGSRRGYVHRIQAIVCQEGGDPYLPSKKSAMSHSTTAGVRSVSHKKRARQTLAGFSGLRGPVTHSVVRWSSGFRWRC
jgi:hypothetical protein